MLSDLARGPPQFAQKRPVAGAEQIGQLADAESGEIIGGSDVIPPSYIGTTPSTVYALTRPVRRSGNRLKDGAMASVRT